jgi:ComF family protein
VWLEADARRTVHAFKYGGLPRLAEDLAHAMTRHLPRPPSTPAATLIPIPLGHRRLRERGYNQSERLARALGRIWRLPVCEPLVRVRETASQTALTPAARLANVAGAFAVRDAGAHFALRTPHPALVLVDDVFTTGATLAEAARALQDAGAAGIAAITFGRAVIPDFL